MIEQMIIAGLGVCVAVLGYGWWRAEQRRADAALDAASAYAIAECRVEWHAQAVAERDLLAAELARLTDRDARGRFVKREGK